MGCIGLDCIILVFFSSGVLSITCYTSFSCTDADPPLPTPSDLSVDSKVVAGSCATFQEVSNRGQYDEALGEGPGKEALGEEPSKEVLGEGPSKEMLGEGPSNDVLRQEKEKTEDATLSEVWSEVQESSGSVKKKRNVSTLKRPADVSGGGWYEDGYWGGGGGGGWYEDGYWGGGGGGGGLL